MSHPDTGFCWQYPRCEPSRPPWQGVVDHRFADPSTAKFSNKKLSNTTYRSPLPILKEGTFERPVLRPVQMESRERDILQIITPETRGKEASKSKKAAQTSQSFPPKQKETDLNLRRLSPCSLGQKYDSISNYRKETAASTTKELDQKKEVLWRKDRTTKSPSKTNLVELDAKQQSQREGSMQNPVVSSDNSIRIKVKFPDLMSPNDADDENTTVRPQCSKFVCAGEKITPFARPKPPGSDAPWVRSRRDRNVSALRDSVSEPEISATPRTLAGFNNTHPRAGPEGHTEKHNARLSSDLPGQGSKAGQVAELAPQKYQRELMRPRQTIEGIERKVLAARIRRDKHLQKEAMKSNQAITKSTIDCKTVAPEERPPSDFYEPATTTHSYARTLVQEAEEKNRQESERMKLEKAKTELHERLSNRGVCLTTDPQETASEVNNEEKGGTKVRWLGAPAHSFKNDRQAESEDVLPLASYGREDDKAMTANMWTAELKEAEGELLQTNSKMQREEQRGSAQDEDHTNEARQCTFLEFSNDDPGVTVYHVEDIADQPQEIEDPFFMAAPQASSTSETTGKSMHGELKAGFEKCKTVKADECCDEEDWEQVEEPTLEVAVEDLGTASWYESLSRVMILP
ncbi:MAG: hypothetical protein Q9227_001316 [Pyrenula ochraceoflavens]